MGGLRAALAGKEGEWSTCQLALGILLISAPGFQYKYDTYLGVETSSKFLSFRVTLTYPFHSLSLPFFFFLIANGTTHTQVSATVEESGIRRSK
jgi:hypothetical protein